MINYKAQKEMPMKMEKVRLINKARKTLRGNSRGVTLIEVLVALALFAIIGIAFAGGLGMNIDLAKVPTDGIRRNDTILFSESQSRFVLTVPAQDRRQFEETIEGCIFAAVGLVTGDEDFVVKGLNDRIIIKANTGELKDAWQKTLRW